MAKRGPKPKDQRLPGTDDGAIVEIETAAAEYAQVRDDRMALNTEEGQLKDRLQVLMRKHGKRSYVHGRIQIDVIDGEEDIKVNLKKPLQTDGDAPAPETAAADDQTPAPDTQ